MPEEVIEVIVTAVGEAIGETVGEAITSVAETSGKVAGELLGAATEACGNAAVSAQNIIAKTDLLWLGVDLAMPGYSPKQRAKKSDPEGVK